MCELQIISYFLILLTSLIFNNDFDIRPPFQNMPSDILQYFLVILKLTQTWDFKGSFYDVIYQPGIKHSLLVCSHEKLFKHLRSIEIMAVIILKDPFKCPWCLCCHANIPARAAWSWELMLISMETGLLGSPVKGCKGISRKSGGVLRERSTYILHPSHSRKIWVISL